ncbi:MAG: FAD:protein FMN transferase [Oligoflexales bacterium]|nr:FAD:protein FMN transferase [Oligoflexales bacterium]
MKYKGLLFFFVFASSFFILQSVWKSQQDTRCSSEPGSLAVWSGPTMGTSYTIKVAGKLEAEVQQTLESACEEALKEVNMLMSTYIPESELSRFNSSPSRDWFPVSPQTLKVVKAGIQIGKLSQGTFDIAIGPLVNLWGFGPTDKPLSIPEKDKISQILEYSRFSLLSTQDEPPAVKKDDTRTYVDLSGIAKGYGVDVLADLLLSRGYPDFMVEIGGEIRTSGKKFGAPWEIAVERPSEKDFGRSVFRVVQLESSAIATSGDYRNYYEEDGQRFSHIIDPRTGYPIEHKVASVTVISSSSMLADAWATAFSVLDENKVKDIAQKLRIPVYLIEKQGEEFLEWYSEDFAKYMKPSPDQQRS